jgi:hypothetical protein
MTSLVLLLALGQDIDFAGARLVNGARLENGVLEFSNALQYAEAHFLQMLDGVEAATVGAWVFPRRAGEQCFVFRGIPECGPNGERIFKAQDDWVNFLIGTVQHGFLLGTIHGNGSMPFPWVTLNDLPIDSWSQVAVVKDAQGFQKFYRNGVLVSTDLDSCHSGKKRLFNDRAPGEPIRLAMPLGGKMGEAWIFPRELSADEIRKDFESKRVRYRPALPVTPVLVREMDCHPSSDLAPFDRERAQKGMGLIFGSMPAEKVPLDPKTISEVDCGSYVRRKVSIQVQVDDRMPAYLLIPKNLKGRVPAIVCFYGTTGGEGKETTVGLTGEKNRGFAVDMVEAGFVAFAADYLRDGERVKPGRRPYDTTDFYAQFPDWSIHGKDAWDTMRAIDYLQSLDFVDPGNIGMTGHSYGGHSTIFTAAMEPRIKAAWANGPVSDFLHHGMHWAVPKGGGASQSLPAMRPYVIDPTLPPPIRFHEVTALIAPRALAVGQAVGERRPEEEENCAAVKRVYQSMGAGDRIRYVWYPGDHDYPPHVRKEAVEWFKRWLH